MLPTSTYRSSTAYRTITPPPLSTVTGPPLPTPDAVDRLQGLSGRKRKATSQDPEATLSRQTGVIQPARLPTPPKINPKDEMIKICRGNHAPKRLFELTRDLGLSLGGPSMPAENRTVLITQITAADRTCSPDQMERIISGLSNSLGGPGMTIESRDTLMQQILGTFATATPKHMGAMILGMVSSFGTLTPENRQWLLNRIMDAHLTCNVNQICHMVAGLAEALGGSGISSNNCSSLVAQILESPRDFKSEVLLLLFQAIGGSHITDRNLGDFIAQILAAHARFGDKGLEQLFRRLFLCLGQAMTPAQHVEFITNIIAAPPGCSATLVDSLLVRQALATNIGSLPTQSRNAIMTLILPAPMSNERIPALIDFFGQLVTTRALVDGILSAGARPIKTGYMIALALRLNHRGAEQHQETVRILDEISSTNDTAPLYKPFIDAGRLAQRGDIGGIVALDGLTDADKLNFVSFSCSITPLDQTSLSSEVGKVLFLELPNPLKTQTLSVLLSKGPFNPVCFTAVRQWLVGTLADIPQMSWTRKKDLVEIDCTSSAFADWYMNITELYHEFRFHMTADFVAKERALVKKNPLLPTNVKEKILGMLIAARPSM